MTAATDYFKEDRDKIRNAYDELAEIGVFCGEWCAENLFGDPDLRHTMLLVNDAYGAIRAAATLLHLAIDAIPAPVET